MCRRPARSIALLVIVLLTAGADGCRGIVDAEAQARLMGRLGETSATVYPTAIRRREIESDRASAEAIGRFLSERGLAEVTLASEPVAIPGPWHHNQARMLRESAEAFARHLALQPVATEYALLAEYLFVGEDEAGGIHAYLLDRDGRIADVALLNSHFEVFRDADPGTVEACTAVLLEVLGDRLPAPASPAHP